MSEYKTESIRINVLHFILSYYKCSLKHFYIENTWEAVKNPLHIYLQTYICQINNIDWLHQLVDPSLPRSLLAPWKWPTLGYAYTFTLTLSVALFQCTYYRYLVNAILQARTNHNSTPVTYTALQNAQHSRLSEWRVDSLDVWLLLLCWRNQILRGEFCRLVSQVWSSTSRCVSFTTFTFLFYSSSVLLRSQFGVYVCAENFPRRKSIKS